MTRYRTGGEYVGTRYWLGEKDCKKCDETGGHLLVRWEKIKKKKKFAVFMNQNRSGSVYIKPVEWLEK